MNAPIRLEAASVVAALLSFSAVTSLAPDTAVSGPINRKNTSWYFRTPVDAHDVAVLGNYAYVADGAGGLLVIDITDPTAPTLAGSLDTPGLARGVAVAGQYVFVADGTSGLQVIDISDPAAPTLVGSFETDDVARQVTCSDGHAFVAAGVSGLQVMDIHDPQAPTREGQRAPAKSPARVTPWKTRR